jgi:hypothetical protein
MGVALMVVLELLWMEVCWLYWGLLALLTLLQEKRRKTEKSRYSLGVSQKGTLFFYLFGLCSFLLLLQKCYPTEPVKTA